MSLAMNSIGLLYTGDGAIYNGRAVSLDDIQHDGTGRFTDRQKGDAKNLQDMHTALGTLEALSAKQAADNRRDGAKSEARRSRSSEGVVISLSIEAQQRLADDGSDSTSPDSSAITPKVTFSGRLQSGDFTLSASANADTGSSKITISGPNGLAITDQVFRASLDTASGELMAGSGVMLQGLSVMARKDGNKEYITLSEASASASTATVSSSNGTVSQSTASAAFDSTTFVVDFNTGTLSAIQSDVSATATAQSSTAPSTKA